MENHTPADDRQAYDLLQVILYETSQGTYRVASYQDHFNETIHAQDGNGDLLDRIKNEFEARLQSRYSARKSDMDAGLNPSGLYHGGQWKREDVGQLLDMAKNLISRGITSLTLSGTKSFTVGVDPSTTFNIEYYLAK